MCIRDRDKVNYVDLVKDIDFKDRRSLFFKELNEEEHDFLEKYVVYGKHLLEEGKLDARCVYTKDTDAYRDLCKNIVGQEEICLLYTSHRHIIICFVTSKTKHHTLVACTCVKFACICTCFLLKCFVNAHSNVW